MRKIDGNASKNTSTSAQSTTTVESNFLMIGPYPMTYERAGKPPFFAISGDVLVINGSTSTSLYRRLLTQSGVFIWKSAKLTFLTCAFDHLLNLRQRHFWLAVESQQAVHFLLHVGELGPHKPD